MSSAEVQIWNNAAFDDGESEHLVSDRPSWGSLKSIFDDPKASFDSESGKENQGSFPENQISSPSSLAKAFQPVNGNRVADKARNFGGLKKDREEITVLKSNNVDEIRDEKKVDEEIQEIENEISRLRSRLDALRLEKMEMGARVLEKRGRVVPAKFMEQKQSVNSTEEKKTIAEVSSTNSSAKFQRRGVSLGPSEIASQARRRASMMPSESFRAEKLKPVGKQDVFTPVQSRRRSCFWKLDEIAEEKERGRGSCVSPKSRKPASKTQVLPRQAITTIASKKLLRKEEGVISSIQPKNLFNDGQKLVASTVKKAVKPGRVVASRYNNQNTSQTLVLRKRFLPENDKEEDGKRCEKKRSLSVGKSSGSVASECEMKKVGSETRVKKQWEIPSEIVVHSSNEEEDEMSPQSIVIVRDMLPKIRIARCVNESPRDSGPAKRVAELIEKKSFFSHDEMKQPSSICQELHYTSSSPDDQQT